MSVSNIRRHTFQSGERVFFDTNIWLHIHGPQGNPENQRMKHYSSAYKDILSRGIKIYLDVTVVGEFVNRFVRIHYDLWQEKNNQSLDFKMYRQTEDYKSVVEQIEQAVHAILVDSTQIESGFSRIDFIGLLKKFTTGKQDFNDLIVLEICKANGFTLVTHDGDFKGAAIPILTSNEKLLS